MDETYHVFALKDLVPSSACAPDALPVTSSAGHTQANRLPRRAPASFDVFDMRFEGVWMSVA